MRRLSGFALAAALAIAPATLDGVAVLGGRFGGGDVPLVLGLGMGLGDCGGKAAARAAESELVDGARTWPEVPMELFDVWVRSVSPGLFGTIGGGAVAALDKALAVELPFVVELVDDVDDREDTLPVRGGYGGPGLLIGGQSAREREREGEGERGRERQRERRTDFRDGARFTL